MRVAIVRPSAVVTNYKYPFEGWTDTVSAAGIMIFPMGMGIAPTESFVTTDFCFGMIPCDYAVNAILVSACYAASTPTNELNVFTSCTSVQNTIGFDQFTKKAIEYLEKNPWNRALLPIDGYYISTSLEEKSKAFKSLITKLSI